LTPPPQRVTLLTAETRGRKQIYGLINGRQPQVRGNTDNKSSRQSRIYNSS